MTLQIQDRVKETTTTTGTGALSLAGAITGFRAFSSVCSNADTCYYALQAVNSSGTPTGNWECGLGTYTTSGNTLTRTTVTSSSNAGALVSLAAGTTQVWIDVIASSVAMTQVGSIIVYAGATVPAGYLAIPTAATTVSRTTFAPLFAVLGTTWGAGDGSTTFGLPFLPSGYTFVQGTLAAQSVGSVISHFHTIGDFIDLEIGYESGGSPAFVGDGASGGTTTSTGGAANLAAGVGFNFAIKF
jgi:hypothetical protein